MLENWKNYRNDKENQQIRAEKVLLPSNKNKRSSTEPVILIECSEKEEMDNEHDL